MNDSPCAKRVRSPALWFCGNLIRLMAETLSGVYTNQWTSPVAEMVKHLPTVWETRIQSLGQEELLEKEMATYSSTLAWKIPWTEEPGRLQSMGSQTVGHDWATSMSMSTPVYVRVLLLQSCLTLYDPMDCSPPGFSVHGVLQARILEWVAYPFSRDLPDPAIKHGSPAWQVDSLPAELSGKPQRGEVKWSRSVVSDSLRPHGL